MKHGCPAVPVPSHSFYVTHYGLNFPQKKIKEGKTILVQEAASIQWPHLSSWATVKEGLVPHYCTEEGSPAVGNAPLVQTLADVFRLCCTFQNPVYLFLETQAQRMFLHPKVSMNEWVVSCCLSACAFNYATPKNLSTGVVLGKPMQHGGKFSCVLQISD